MTDSKPTPPEQLVPQVRDMLFEQLLQLVAGNLPDGYTITLQIAHGQYGYMLDGPRQPTHTPVNIRKLLNIEQLATLLNLARNMENLPPIEFPVEFPNANVNQQTGT